MFQKAVCGYRRRKSCCECLEAPGLVGSAWLKWAVPSGVVLSRELGKLEAASIQLIMRVTVVQGAKDSLDPKTVNEFGKYAPVAWLKVKNLPNETHFMLWEKPQIIVDAIKETPCASSP